ncbi:MAG: ABC transporter ATP-binding protein [Elusimicrobia bacterium]|nr:ABC transporter ATP-binding protein [Elusimicrobiota bacterium]
MTEKPAPLLEVRDLSVSVSRDGAPTRILRGVNYRIYPGETLAIVGESGSGKTLGALSVVRLLPPGAKIDSGGVLYGGKDLASLSEEELREVRGAGISMVFQEPMTSLNPVLTIGLQLAEPLMEHKGLSYAQALPACAGLLEKVGITDAKNRLAQYPHNFSGGMRQRVMIAMALACGPDLVIADEPTTALDVTVQAQILDLVDALKKESGMALALITHNLGIVAQRADYVLVFYAGRVFERAPAAEFFKSPANPYSRALLNSLPRWSDKPGEPLKTIEGLPPSFDEDPPGCPFAPRCPEVFEKCRGQEPPEFRTGERRASKCWRSEAGFEL